MMDNDVNDQFTQFSEKQKPDARKRSVFLVVTGVWFTFCLIWVLLYFPRMRDAVKETDFFNVISNISEYSVLPDTKTADLFFFDIDENPVKVNSRIVITGATDYHDAIEGLLRGPDNNALIQGAVTCIPNGTVLKGLTVQGRWAFINLSQDFLNQTDPWTRNSIELASRQILLTLNSLDNTITDLIILIDGVEQPQLETTLG